EVLHADHIFVMDGGRVVMEGNPREIFSQVERLKELRLTVPQPTLLANALKDAGLPSADTVLTREELVEAVASLLP
ncbi:MAG: energy-coupling factor transporter ATPase, partial [Lachnospiraceae bacterium]|nr:energy-coupling factor transporter ATPase [Lachnospiraceae bacterium]